MAYSYKYSHTPTDRCMPKVISDYTKNVKLYIIYLLVLHETIVEGKLALDVFPFHMPSAILHQIFDINIQSLS